MMMILMAKRLVHDLPGEVWCMIVLAFCHQCWLIVSIFSISTIVLDVSELPYIRIIILFYKFCHS